jgi:hypothetical protein
MSMKSALAKLVAPLHAQSDDTSGRLAGKEVDCLVRDLGAIVIHTPEAELTCRAAESANP